MTNTPSILLLPPPTAVPAAAKADRVTALPPVAPAQPRADKNQNATSDQLGFKEADPSARNATSPVKQADRSERWLTISLFDTEADAGPWAIPNRSSALPFLAQQIAQEVMSSGLHREPWESGLTAYRRAGGEPPLPASGSPLVQLSA